MKHSTQEQLLNDLSKVVREFEELVHATADDASSEVASARKQAQRSLKSMRRQIASSAEEQWSRAKRVARTTDTYVHDKAWQATGIALLTGVVVGMLIKPDREPDRE